MMRWAGFQKIAVWLSLLDGGAVSDPHPGTDLLMEDGAFFLLEDGSSTILLEV